MLICLLSAWGDDSVISRIEDSDARDHPQFACFTCPLLLENTPRTILTKLDIQPAWIRRQNFKKVS